MSEPVAIDCSVPHGSVLGPVKFISYTDGVTSVFKKHGVRHHLYADDKQGYVDVPISNIATARTTVQGCVSNVSSWCSSRRLQVNTGKTELIWFGTRQSLHKAKDDNVAPQLESGCIEPVGVVRDLGVLLDSELTMKHHVSKVASILASINYAGCDSLDVLLARRLQHSWFLRSFCPALITVTHCWRDYRAVRSSICGESRMRLLASSATCVHTTTSLQP